MDVFLILTSLAKTIGIIFLIILPMVSYTVYAERRVSALIQDRLGPNRVGPAGLFQPIADAMKFLLKEDFTPAHVNTFYYWLAPCLAMVPAIATIAVVPFGSTLFGVPRVIADINVGVLYVFAIASLGVYGIVIAGWSSNSKYPFLGGVRSTSQMISYELSLGLAVIPIFLLVGQLRLTSIVQYQIDHGWMIAPFIGDWTNLGKWLLAIPMFISFCVFTVAIFAETNRLPFDLPEAETELVGGYHTEYGSMKFALFFLGEYAAMITGSAIIVTLFLGGWHFPGIPDGSHGWIFGLLNIAVFFAKVAALLLVFIWVRWTLPRFRYDQLMRLGWIFFFEIALVNIFLAALIIAYFPV
ncbi:MAG: NADH-quinone oxidoreductase subunit NuoH [Chthoniobacterales bacterium]